MTGHAITLEEVKEIASECNVEFKPGDIFFIRCGFTKTWESISLDEVSILHWGHVLTMY